MKHDWLKNDMPHRQGDSRGFRNEEENDELGITVYFTAL